MPDDPVCRAITAQLDRPLLCSSVHTEGMIDFFMLIVRRIHVVLRCVAMSIYAMSFHTDDVVVDDSSVMLPDPALLYDAYAGRGIDFMVSDGRTLWTAGICILCVVWNVLHGQVV